ncbi:arylsulfatase [Larkinella bovis]|uniref:Arylsulfatase n=1 Tax=Larkinella bovis TaxID=683041 RepID=A0ABW0IAD4_9BACT
MNALKRIIGLIGICWLTILNVNAQRPNIVLILTDDQGYGDLGCTGNPWIQTPNIDQLYARSIRFTDFHVATTCAPTRAGLLTGKNCNRVGAWHTIQGRQILRKEEQTLAQLLKNAGYRTGIFGKWHLGDNYPFRPQDRGFDEVLIHGGGGVTQTPDFWENDYFDDTYYHNGKPQKYAGYCTDVWFQEATKFIQSNRKNPFFCYIATNAPHSPFNVDEKYSKPYENNPAIPNANFYGMITNIDEQVGRLVEQLKKDGLYENTIFIFMTDNGTSAGVRFDENRKVVAGYNAGMRGTKASPYDGGHRVPFILHWPKGGIKQGKDIHQLAAYTDVVPTLLDLCKVPKPKSIDFDGISLKPWIQQNPVKTIERVLVADVQREEFLVKWKQSAVMTPQWRLINGTELYDITQDKAQEKSVAQQHPDVVARLKEAYEKWWEKVSIKADEYSRVEVGTPFEPITQLTAHDLHTEAGFPAWNQDMVRGGTGVGGFWALNVAKAGRYQIELRRYPIESGLSLGASAKQGSDVPGGKPYTAGKPLTIQKARLKLGEKQLEQAVSNTEVASVFTLELEKGDLDLAASLLDAENKSYSPYYVYIKPL